MRWICKVKNHHNGKKNENHQYFYIRGVIHYESVQLKNISEYYSAILEYIPCKNALKVVVIMSIQFKNFVQQAAIINSLNYDQDSNLKATNHHRIHQICPHSSWDHFSVDQRGRKIYKKNLNMTRIIYEKCFVDWQITVVEFYGQVPQAKYLLYSLLLVAILFKKCNQELLHINTIN